MTILVLSSSLDPSSRSRQLAHVCHKVLKNHDISTTFIDLARLEIPNFDNDKIYKSEAYLKLHQATSESDGVVLCSPVYNWGVSSEIKKYIEYVGSTPPDGSLKGALFDKVNTFVNADGLPHSYTAFREMATSLMLDFKCIINPYHIYAHSRNWENDALSEEKMRRVEKSVTVMLELCEVLEGRSYHSTWEI